MGDVVYRANLKAVSFPFLSELFGRSIIVKGQDQNAPIGKIEAGTSDSTNQGIPQIYYCENVIPTDNGYKSVGYTSLIAAAATGGFVSVEHLRDGAGNSGSIAITSTGVLYRRHSGGVTWTAIGAPPLAGTIAGKRMTVAYVSEVSYIYFANVGCFTYDFATGDMTASPLTFDAPTTEADILGVAANRGYLIAFSGVTTDPTIANAVFWSSTIDPTDFLASLATGAGWSSLEGARGTIVTIESVYGGFIVFTAANCVSAVASDNARFPYNFVEITGGGGLTSPDYVSYDANSSSLYAYTTAGLQQIGIKLATSVFPEVTDFISGNQMENFNSITNVLTTVSTAGAVLEKRLVVVGSRYLILSYGLTSLTHALVYDTAFKQWGRLKFTHIDCFELGRTNVETPKKSIAFTTASGLTYILDMDINSTNSSGVMILGKFQYVRSRLLQLQRVAFENVNAGDTFELLDLPAADGKNFGTALAGYLSSSAGKYREYLFHNTSINHSLLCKGAFNAVSLELTFTVSGAR